MNNELQHHGILGQKWGKRNGPPYPLSASKSASIKKRRKKTDDDSEKEDRKKAMKNRRNLSTAELNERISRLKLEKQFKDLTEDDISPGKKFVKKHASKILTTTIVGAGTYALKSAVSKEFDPKEFANYTFPNPNKKK